MITLLMKEHKKIQYLVAFTRRFLQTTAYNPKSKFFIIDDQLREDFKKAMEEMLSKYDKEKVNGKSND